MMNSQTRTERTCIHCGRLEPRQGADMYLCQDRYGRSGHCEFEINFPPNMNFPKMELIKQGNRFASRVTVEKLAEMAEYPGSYRTTGIIPRTMENLRDKNSWLEARYNEDF